MLWMDTELKVSKLPKIGETATVTFVVSDFGYGGVVTSPSGMMPNIAISTNYEFVDIPSENIIESQYEKGGKTIPYYQYKNFESIWKNAEPFSPEIKQVLVEEMKRRKLWKNQ